MNNAQSNLDEDILRCRAEILKVKGRSLIPPFGGALNSPAGPAAVQASTDVKADHPQPVENVSEPLPQNDDTSVKEILPDFETTDAEQNPSADDTDSGFEASEIPASQEQEPDRIPVFNLAEQIMAEQRKFAGNKRKGPGQQKIPITELAVSPKKLPKTETPHWQQKIIADIVAADIERMKNPILSR